MNLYDSHMHTDHSFDSVATLESMCRAAINRDMRGICITEHNDPTPEGFALYRNVFTNIKKIRDMEHQTQGKLKIRCGVEIANLSLGFDPAPFYDMDLDYLLCSMHALPVLRKYFPMSPVTCDIKCFASFSEDADLARFVQLYYEELLYCVREFDTDAVAHLTFPLRYIRGSAHREFDLSPFYPLIDEILKLIITTGRALEVNTSGLYVPGWRDYMPDRAILERYYRMGGRTIAIGSDAHEPKRVGVGIKHAHSMLKKIGFTHGVFYTRRKPEFYLL